MTLKKILEKTKEYLQIPSVIRFEQRFMEHLADDFSKPNYKVDKQARFLVVSKKGEKSGRILTAHIDRHGIVVNDKGEFEYAAFNAKKHYGDENKSSEAVIKKAGERFIGESVINGQLEGKVRAYNIDGKNLYFEVEGIKAQPGVVLAYKAPTELVKNGKISGQIDNAVSAAVAYQLIEDGFDGRIVFATEEEIGRSWKHITDYLDSLDKPSQEIITLDTTSYDNERSIDEGLVVLRNKDEKGKFNPNLVARLRKICEEGNIKYEIKDEIIEAENAKLPEDKKKKLGITELGRIVEHTNGRFNGATVQLPTTNYHSNHETTSELAIENYYGALTKLLA